LPGLVPEGSGPIVGSGNVLHNLVRIDWSQPDGGRIRSSIGVMAYDEDLADRIRQLLAGEEQVTEKKMFGGLAFLINGNMAIAASGQGGILVRFDPKKAVPRGAEPAIMRDRPMDGWLRVAHEGLRTKSALSKWVRTGTTYARSLPRKV
jgi:hypothetical protein